MTTIHHNPIRSFHLCSARALLVQARRHRLGGSPRRDAVRALLRASQALRDARKASMAKQTTRKRAEHLMRRARQRVALHDRQLTYLSDTVRHGMLCREAVYLLAAQHEPLPAEVVAELVQLLVAECYRD